MAERFQIIGFWDSRSSQNDTDRQSMGKGPVPNAPGPFCCKESILKRLLLKIQKMDKYTCKLEKIFVI